MDGAEKISLALNYGLPFAVLILAYLIGSFIEKKHIRDIQKREDALHGFPVTTFEALPPNWKVLRCQMVTGSVVVSLDYFKRVIAGLRGLIGGRVKTYEPLLERARQGRPVSKPALLTVGSTALIGLCDEGIQAVLPNRFFDWNDVFFNALAGFMVIAARLALGPVRFPSWRLWFLWFLVGAIGWGICTDVGTFGPGRRFAILPFLPTVDVPRYLSVAAGGGSWSGSFKGGSCVGISVSSYPGFWLV